MISKPLISADEALTSLETAVVLDARAGPEATRAFLASHVRGAIHADLERDLSEVGEPIHGGRHPLPGFRDWLARLGAWGIRSSTPVLIYDDGGGAMAAARAWWMLRAVGHEQVAVVDGGWSALVSAGAPLDQGASRARSAEAYSTSVDDWPDVDAELVEQIRGDSAWRLIDARAPERYAGRVEPIDPERRR